MLILQTRAVTGEYLRVLLPMTDKKALEATLVLSDRMSTVLSRAGVGSLELTIEQELDVVQGLAAALDYSDALAFSVGASVSETLGVVDALARFVSDTIVEVSPLRALMDPRHIVAIDDAVRKTDSQARLVLLDSSEVASLVDHATTDAAVVFADLLSLDEAAWTGFQSAIVQVFALLDSEVPAINLLVDLGNALALADQIPSLSRFRAALLWFRERAV
jgi:hypothetical protein